MSDDARTPSVRPFLKWAGSKRASAEAIVALMPPAFDVYVEPFVGAGAVLARVLAEGRATIVAAGDTNGELINAWEQVRAAPQNVIDAYDRAGESSRENYNRIRALDPDKLKPATRAARTIWLNRHCYNGLYRLNKKGKFNVPWGKYKIDKPIDEENLLALADLLDAAGALFLERDFSDLLAAAVKHARAGKKVVVYADPPYFPRSKTSNFRAYTEDGFGTEDQARLAHGLRWCAQNGVHVIASNADVPEARALYEGFQITTLEVARSINCKGKRRGAVSELLIASISAPAAAQAGVYARAAP